MTLFTRYNDYPFPEKNSTEWHEEFKTAFVQIDADIAGATQEGLTKDSLSANEALQTPVYADLTTHPSPSDGDVAYVDGTGTLAEGLYVYDGTQWTGPLTEVAGSTTPTAWTELSDVEVGTLANRPAAGTAGLWYFTTDIEGAFYDTGTAWQKALLAPGQIAESDLAFDTATQLELTDHANLSGAHHSRYSDVEARTAVEGLVDAANLAGGSGITGQALFTDGNQAFWGDVSGSGGGTQIAEGTFTHTTGSHSEFSIFNLTTDEQATLTVDMAPSVNGQTTNDYAFNHDASQHWDSTSGEVQLDVILNWDIDPGVDMNFDYTVRAT